MPVTLQNGPDTNQITRIGPASNRQPVVGATIRQVVNDASIKQIYDFDGREVYEVREAGSGATWTQVSDNYVLQDGDTLRFAKASGEKGVLIISL